MSVGVLATVAQILIGMIIAFVVEVVFLARLWEDMIGRVPVSHRILRKYLIVIRSGAFFPLILMTIALGLCFTWIVADRQPPTLVSSLIVLFLFIGLIWIVGAPMARVLLQPIPNDDGLWLGDFSDLRLRALALMMGGTGAVNLVLMVVAQVFLWTK